MVAQEDPSFLLVLPILERSGHIYGPMMFFPVSNSFSVHQFWLVNIIEYLYLMLVQEFPPLLGAILPCLHISHVQTHGWDLCSDGGLWGGPNGLKYISRETYRLKQVESLPASGWLVAAEKHHNSGCSHQNCGTLAMMSSFCFFQETGKLVLYYVTMFAIFVINCNSCPEI